MYSECSMCIVNVGMCILNVGMCAVNVGMRLVNVCVCVYAFFEYAVLLFFTVCSDRFALRFFILPTSSVVFQSIFRRSGISAIKLASQFLF